MESMLINLNDAIRNSDGMVMDVSEVHAKKAEFSILVTLPRVMDESALHPEKAFSPIMVMPSGMKNSAIRSS